MNRVWRVFAIAALSAILVPVTARAADLGNDQWPTKHRDPGNTSSTSVDLYDPVGGEELKVLWRSPGGGLPLVYSYTDSGGERVQRVITGPFVYDAWTGDLVAVLPYAGEANPMDGVPTVGIDTSTGVLLTYSFERDKYYAYDSSKGKYTFDGVSPGEYEVSAAKDGSEDSELVSMPTPPATISGVDLSL